MFPTLCRVATGIVWRFRAVYPNYFEPYANLYGHYNLHWRNLYRSSFKINIEHYQTRSSHTLDKNLWNVYWCIVSLVILREWSFAPKCIFVCTSRPALIFCFPTCSPWELMSFGAWDRRCIKKQWNKFCFSSWDQWLSVNEHMRGRIDMCCRDLADR